MVETAAFLVDQVLPAVPYRQWVLTVPFRLRLLLARRPELVTSVLGAFLGVVGGLLRRKAREIGARDGEVGSVTFVQRFGDALNLHVHFHAVLPDGVFTIGDAGAVVFHKVSLTDEEVSQVCMETSERVLRLLEKQGLSDIDESPDALATLQAVALQSTMGFLTEPREQRPKRLCAAVEGFTVHASVHLHANDREGLERLLRYGGRPCFSLSRLRRLPDGRVTYQLKRPLPNGVATLVLPPLKFLARLAAMVPPPRAHLVRYHGCFAPNAKLRPAVVLKSAAPSDERAGAENKDATSLTPPLDWAGLLRRVYAADVLQCPKCQGKLKVLAFLSDGPVVKKVLTHLGLPTSHAPLAPVRYEPEQLPLDVPFAGESTALYAASAQGPPTMHLLAA
jgi:hypothetical protein